MDDQTKVVTAIKTIVDGRWQELKLPVLLSSLPKILERECPDFRGILGHRTLKAFIKETEVIGGYAIAEHPTQRARVGVAPTVAAYAFPVNTSAPTKMSTPKSNRETTLAFLRALDSLPGPDLDNVVIPVSVLVKLLK